ncbi:MAG: class I SAM-dependent methyltransferase [Acidobacteriia bacterium]|nr:class I SAM-dependent methyltransferase [Terriglobia bacterium]
MQRRSFVLALAVAALTLSACRGQESYQAEAERLTPLLHWQAGSVVADIGAGDGEMTVAAAERVGPTGRVYTTEIDAKKLEHLEGLATKSQNLTAVQAAEAETNLPPACCNSILLRRVYHHFPQPAEMDASLFKSLKPGGLLAVIDFPPRSGLPEIKEHVPKNRGGHGVAEKIVVEELTAAGFEVVSRPANWPDDDYCVIFRKPANP